MSFKDSKVVIVGLGNVGATTAYSIINQGLCEEIVLIDIAPLLQMGGDYSLIYYV